MKRVTDILNALGGSSAVAQHLGVNYQTVASWRLRGFPAARCIELRNLAKARGVRLSVEDFINAVPVEPRKAEARA